MFSIYIWFMNMVIKWKLKSRIAVGFYLKDFYYMYVQVISREITPLAALYPHPCTKKCSRYALSGRLGGYAHAYGICALSIVLVPKNNIGGGVWRCQGSDFKGHCPCTYSLNCNCAEKKNNHYFFSRDTLPFTCN